MSLMRRYGLNVNLGKIHLWWLNKFINNGGSMVVSGYEGSPYGKALAGLIKRGFIEYDKSFGDLARLTMTKKGYEIFGIEGGQ